MAKTSAGFGVEGMKSDDVRIPPDEYLARHFQPHSLLYRVPLLLRTLHEVLGALCFYSTRYLE